MKKILLIIISIIIIVLGIVIGTKYIGVSNTYTVTIDLNNGSKLQELKVKENKTVKLPTPTKEGYIFNGWLLDDKIFAKDTKITKDIKLVADWLKEGVKTYTVHFDANGGNKIDDIKAEYNKPLKMPENPIKEGYTFMTWVDKDGRVYSEGALLSDAKNDELFLIAQYQSNEETNKKKISYTCPKGYTLKIDKCIIEEEVLEKCSDKAIKINNKCVTISHNTRINYIMNCKKKKITYNNHSNTEKGEVYNNICLYHKTTDKDSKSCSSNGYIWIKRLKACYVAMDKNNMDKSCPEGYMNIENPNSYPNTKGIPAGCFRISNIEKYCSKDYKLVYNKCIKTIDATAN